MVLHYTLNGTDDHTMDVPDTLGVSLHKSYVGVAVDAQSHESAAQLPANGRWSFTSALALVDVDSQRVELYGARNRELGFGLHGLPVR